MRLLALALTSQRQQVAYRWLDDPFAPPRLLVDSARTPLLELRETLEQTILGEPLGASEYQLVTANGDDLAAIQEAFPGLEVVVLPGVAFEDLLYAALPGDFQALCSDLAKSFEVHGRAGESEERLAAIARDTSLYITGRSERALAPILGQLPQANWIERTESSAEGSIRGIRFAVLPLAGPVRADLPLPLLILAVGSDPGLHRDELELIERAERAVLIVVNTSNTSEDYQLVIDYLRQVPGERVRMVTDADDMAAAIREALLVTVRSQLLGWLEVYADIDNLDSGMQSRVQMAAQSIEKFML